MRIEWEERSPLAGWLPKRSPTRGLLAGEAGLAGACTFAFSPGFSLPGPSRAVAPAVGEALKSWHREAGAPEASMAGTDLLIRGAGAVVTRSIPDGEIWAGNPARFLRKVNPDE